MKQNQEKSQKYEEIVYKFNLLKSDFQELYNSNQYMAQKIMSINMDLDSKTALGKKTINKANHEIKELNQTVNQLNTENNKMELSIAQYEREKKHLLGKDLGIGGNS